MGAVALLEMRLGGLPAVHEMTKCAGKRCAFRRPRMRSPERCPQRAARHAGRALSNRAEETRPSASSWRKLPDAGLTLADRLVKALRLGSANAEHHWPYDPPFDPRDRPPTWLVPLAALNHRPTTMLVMCKACQHKRRWPVGELVERYGGRRVVQDLWVR